MTVTLYIGDVHDRLAEIPDHSIDFIACSPPFLALRSYLPDWHPDKAKELGSEPTPADFIDALLALTAQWRQLLSPWGSIAVELGDTYAGSGGAGGDYNPDGLRDGQPRFRAQRVTPDLRRDGDASDYAQGGQVRIGGGTGWPLEQSLVGIPHAYVLSLTYGWNILRRNPDDSPAGRWRIRNYKAWTRSNPPVGALGRKERPATSYITVACLRTDRFFDLDAVRQPLAPSPGNRYVRKVSATDNQRRPDGSQAVSTDNRITKDYDPSQSGGAPPLDWEHSVDLVLDAELNRRADKLIGRTPGGGRHKFDQNDARTRHADANGMVGARGHHLRKALQAAHILPPDPDTYTISPKGYSGAHYAVWPSELAARLIDEHVPHRVCTVCGQPSERITTVDYDAHGDPTQQNNEHKAQADYPLQQRQQNAQGMTHGRATKNTTTVGWSDCGHNTWRPGRILDPFSGSGTTITVANDRGLDAHGIDIDQNAYGMTIGRMGPLIANIDLTVHWPEPNWNAPTLPLGGGDYAEWRHQIGDQRTAIRERLAAGLASFLSGVPTRAPEPTPVAFRTSRPVVEVPGQGVLL